MKKIILTFSTILLLMLINASLSAQTAIKGKSLFGHATAAAASCINDFRAKGFDIKATVETTGICFLNGTTQKVTFYAVTKCRTNPCPRPFPHYVASVYFDCDSRVVAVECAK